MDNARTEIASLEYPGRLIVIGASAAGAAVIVYAITGRSPSSQARRLVSRDGGVWVEPTDEATLKQGNVDLLVYPALLIGKSGIAVSNGKQTAGIRDRLEAGAAPVAALAEALVRWDFEPDAPIFTPRISGALAGGAAALSVLRRGPAGRTLRNYYETDLSGAGEGRLVSTYEGPNADPLPAFRGEPRFVDIPGAAAAETAETVYGSLGPAGPGKDFRVAVACAVLPRGASRADIHIINRHERT